MITNVLVQDLYSRLIYTFEESELDSYRLSNETLGLAFLREIEKRSLLENLDTRELYEIPSDFLISHSIPDESVGSTLRALQITGVHLPFYTIGSENFPALSGIFSKPSWISVNLGGSCNSRCKFCYTEWTRNKPDFSNSEVRIILRQIRNITDLKSIVFTGGEPTIRGDLGEIFTYAQSLGFQNISLQTHGQFLHDVEKLNNLIQSGLTDVMVSLHGHNAQVHERITGSFGSYQKVIQSLHNLAASSLTVTVNIVICLDNFQFLPEIIDELSQIRNSNWSVRFSYPIFEGAGFDNLELVAVPFHRIQSYLVTAIKNAENFGFLAQVFGIPLCILPGHIRIIPEQVNTPPDNNTLLSASVFNRYNIPRSEAYVKLQRCGQCKLSARCAGVQISYLRQFPDLYDEFSPVK